MAVGQIEKLCDDSVEGVRSLIVTIFFLSHFVNGNAAEDIQIAFGEELQLLL